MNKKKLFIILIAAVLAGAIGVSVFFLFNNTSKKPETEAVDDLPSEDYYRDRVKLLSLRDSKEIKQKAKEIGIKLSVTDDKSQYIVQNFDYYSLSCDFAYQMDDNIAQQIYGTILLDSDYYENKNSKTDISKIKEDVLNVNSFINCLFDTNTDIGSIIDKKNNFLSFDDNNTYKKC